MLTLGRWPWIALGIVAALAGAYVCGRMDGAAHVQTRWDEERIATAAAVQRSTERARLVEQQASQSIARQQERTNETLNDLNRRHARALERVRQQAGDGGRDLPNRAAAEPADCAGAGVLAGDGVLAVADPAADQRWLLDLARDADATKVALDACRSWSEAVRAMQ